MAAVKEDLQITCRLSTELPEPFRVSQAPIAVPASLTRHGFSQVLNALLSLDPPRPFDILADGKLLRQTLEQFLLANSISTERILDVEYTFAVLPPEPQLSIRHDDWVGAICSGQEETIITGAYDGVVRMYDGNARCQASTGLHKGPITALASTQSGADTLIMTAGKDQSLLLSRLCSQDGAVSREARYAGHTDEVGCLAVDPTGARFCSGAWDATMRIWGCGEQASARQGLAANVHDGAERVTGTRKGGAKRLRAVDGQAVGTAPSMHAALQVLQGHSQCVAGVSWAVSGHIYSGSWDHAVGEWDIEKGARVSTHASSKAIYCVDACKGAQVVAFGGAEHAVHVWDPRAPVGQEKVVQSLRSHAGWVAAVAWHPTSAHYLASGSYDGSVKLWDLRTPIPLHTLTAHSDKVLAVAWTTASCIASGGADCMLQTSRVLA